MAIQMPPGAQFNSQTKTPGLGRPVREANRRIGTSYFMDRRTAGSDPTHTTNKQHWVRKVVSGGSDLCEFAIIGAADDREVEAAVCGGRKDSLAQVVPPVGVCLAVRTSIQHYFSGLRSPPSPPPPGQERARRVPPPCLLGVRRPFAAAPLADHSATRIRGRFPISVLSIDDRRTCSKPTAASFIYGFTHKQMLTYRFPVSTTTQPGAHRKKRRREGREGKKASQIAHWLERWSLCVR